MAKGRKHGGRKQQIKKGAKNISKGQKRHLKEYGEQHPVDEEYEVGKSLKRPRKEFSNTKKKDENLHEVTQSHESDSSDSEGNADPYLELLGMFGIDSGSDMNQLMKKWKDNENEVGEANEEEMEDDDEYKSEKERNKNRKQVNGHTTQTEVEKSQQNKGKSSNNVDHNMAANVYGKENVTQGNSDVESDDDDDGSDADDNEDDVADENEADADDYRKENEAVEESDDEKEDGDSNNGDDVKDRPLAGNKDPFVVHFEQDLDETAENHLSDLNTWQKKTNKIPSLGSISEIFPSVEALPTVCANANEEATFTDLKIKARLVQGWERINKTPNPQGLFTPLQQDLFRHINSYQDVFYSNRTFQNGDEIRSLYCLHAVNHVLKTRSRVVKNTARIVQSWKDKKEIGELRDQGLTRPKVVVLVPFRDAALKVVEALMQLICPGDGGQVMNKKRFYDEFSDKEESDNSKDFRAEDFKLLFAGNIDDCFRLGISVSRKSMTLYAKFYSSDIIVASPLGLRTIIGSQGEKSHEYDFLSSIEVIIMDQTDVFLMQNWEHVQHIFEHLHLQPKDSHDVDFSRVRMWCLNGLSKYYRQSLIFSSFVSPEMNSLFNKHCCNFAGKVKACPSDVPGSICQVVVQVPQAFHRFECSTFAETADKRFNIFINKVLPEFKGSLMGHTAIFVPSYFDFVRLRNYFKREAIECAQISEYSQQKEIQRARTYFRQGKRPFLLFTERFYFFYRYRIKGIKNIIFYELPHFSAFYSDILNYMDTRKSHTDSQINPVTCTVLYTKLNALRLAGVVGTQRCSHMISSEKNVHMFVTGDDEA